jgi:hypothetical protein
VVLCIGSIATFEGASAAAKTRRPRRPQRCNAHRHHAAAATRQVIVYKKGTGYDNYGGGPLYTYYACLRPAGKPIAVGQVSTGGGEYVGNYGMYELHVAGRFVADLSASGFASQEACYKYDPNSPDCANAVSWWVEAADAKSRRMGRAPVPSSVGPLTVSSAGAVAWIGSTASASHALQAIVLHRAGRHGLTANVQTIDTGSISGVRFTGLTLHWSNDGQAKSQTLG